MSNSDNQHIHLKICKRNARRCITFVHGVADIYDQDKLKAITKQLKKKLSCSAAIVKCEEDDKSIIKLSGDHREEIKNIFTKDHDIDENNITIHGY